ncbi:FliA/WhiG family RNA polymerase sigma factor [Maridesulfovibrio sp.]|uniref:FliA/WhiG family RNA polymerase sigma factor n=1 Tax=Maridesulfovibrio sp. TaxID=2795000 RepID=UPI002A18BDA6|nr:FliA/WhiG family RNA polymerase sigma factor [Maridesulfovibrio sp.]
MVISSSSGKNSSSKNSPWLNLESGNTGWEDFSPADQEAIVRHYSPKIRIIALRMKSKLPQNVELGELISAGSLGLVESLGKFRPELKIKFETYAENRIKGAMLDELRRMDWFSRGLRQKVKTIETCIREIEHETGEKPTSAQLEEATGFSAKEVQQGLEALQNQLCVNLDAFNDNIPNNKDSQLEDEPFQSAVFQETVDKVADLIDNLTPREKLVLSLYYGEELNMKETSEVMDITEGRVSQLHSQALKKLRQMFHDKYSTEP